ncbi:Phage protein Gp19/Gp15/Gp42 [Bifidobacterium pseudolongum subsp. globosum]|uniref:Phage protein Gp19/Gp15/Gp42 n=1 Tax=Bifidobacterium pseudolongum subsp. globosum TaxID=1690 RepID=A0A4Q5AWS0_9BIFI|nr:Gp19/Gp15/Gp42 family protein [Bifidobacterium pseudolongum]RYQ39381.1 Phage protein Gp19/Gp15/Gp42 [Bifidobacterium pseudolongum subsp. globosum]
MTDGYPQAPVPLSVGIRASAPATSEATGGNGPFAIVEDLEARWHALTSEERRRAERLLADASDLIRTSCPNWSRATPLTLERVACSIVKRAMLASDDIAGVTQHSQTAGSYSESFSYSNPDGDLYLTRSEKESLGGDGVAWAYDPAVGTVT